MKLSVFLAVLVVSTVWAQPDPDTLWTSLYGGDGDDRAACIQQTADSGYIIAGTGNDGDCYLVKTDQLGNVMWTQSFGEEGYDKANSVQQTPDGGYIVACEKNGHYWLVKTDQNGDTLWSETGPGGFAYDIQIDRDGGYIVGGGTYELGAQAADILLTKYNSTGDLLWQRIYGTSFIDYCFAVYPTQDNGYIMAGCTNRTSSESDGYVVKTDSVGNVLWDYTYGSVGWDLASGVVETLEGDYVVAGTMTTSGVINAKSVIIKLGADGDTVWVRTLDILRDNHASDVRLTTDGGYIVTSIAHPTESNTCLLFKMNSSGDTLWTRIYGTHEYAYAISGLQTIDGGYVIAGYAPVLGTNIDMYVLKTGPDGGSAVPLGTDVDVPRNYVMHPVYPNPFNAMAAITYEMLVTDAVQVSIYDVLGRKVATLMDEQVGAGIHQIVWDAGNMPSGVYFCRMSASDFRQTRKFVLLK